MVINTDNLKELLFEKKHVTAAEISDRTGISRAQIGRLRRGESGFENLQLHNAVKLQQCYNDLQAEKDREEDKEFENVTWLLFYSDIGGAEIARRTGLSESLISRIKDGSRTISDSVFERLSQLAKEVKRERGN